MGAVENAREYLLEHGERIGLRVTIVDEHHKRRHAFIYKPDYEDFIFYSGQSLVNDLVRVFPDLAQWKQAECSYIDYNRDEIAFTLGGTFADQLRALEEREGMEVRLFVYQTHEIAMARRAVAVTTSNNAKRAMEHEGEDDDAGGQVAKKQCQ